jgi:hypothetical protein
LTSPKQCQQLGRRGGKRLLVAISVLLIATALTITSLLFFLPKLATSSISLVGKVKLFVVHYADGVNMTVDPSTKEGQGLSSACEAVLKNLKGHLPLVLTGEQMRSLKERSTYLDVLLDGEQSFSIYSELTNPTWPIEVRASRVLIFLGGEPGLVSFNGGQLPSGEVIWGDNWKAKVESRQYQELVDMVNKLRR